MKAIVCAAHGLPETLRLQEIDPPAPGPHQVLIAVRAAGVNFPDGLMIQGKYQTQPALPFTPGSEVAGVVTAVGAEVVGIAPGMRVAAPIGWGGFAEQAVAEDWRVLPLPDALGFDVAAGMGLTYGTSYHALKDRAQLRAGETLLVLGAAGGVGLAAIELGKALGARVIAAASSEAKLAICREHGADETIDYGTEDLRAGIKRIVGDAGVDVVFDPVGGALTEAAFRSTGWDGRHLVIGFAAGDVPRIPLNLPLLKSSSIVGVFWGAFVRKFPELNRRNSLELLDMAVAGRIKPRICARFPLERGGDAIAMVLGRQATGKVIVEVGHD